MIERDYLLDNRTLKSQALRSFNEASDITKILLCSKRSVIFVFSKLFLVLMQKMPNIAK